MRRFAFAFSAVLALAILAVPADAQLKFGGQVALITGLDDIATDVENPFNGTFGVGGRVGFEPPLSPIGVYGSVTYYFPSDSDVNYWTGSIFGKLGLPLPVVSPYAVVGLQRRATSVGSLDESDNGFFAGVGVSLSSLFIEGTMEFNDEDVPDVNNSPIVLKGGFMIG